MKNTQDIPWIRIAAEATAVLVSILLAFAIDAWWAERLERIAEREELSRLYDEFASNRERIDNRVSSGGMMHRPREAALRLSELLDTAIKSGSETILVPDVAIAVLIGTATFEADSPVLDSLIRSGRIEIIENRAVVNAIAVWERSLRNTAEQQQATRRFVVDQLLPVFAANNNIQHVLLNQLAGMQVAPLDPNGVTEIRVDPFLVNLVAQRYFWAALVLRSLTATRDSADHVMSVISKSSDRSKI
jgi:hypothetical protein